MIVPRIFSFTRTLSVIGAFWAMLLAFIIIADIIGREVYGHPLPGVIEIVGNSIIAILFLQIPAAVHSGTMLRTTMVYERFGETGRRVIDMLAFSLGLFFFIGLVIGSWPDMVTGVRIREYEGEGSFHVPVYLVRVLIVTMSMVTAAVYAALIWHLFARGGRGRAASS